MEMVNERVESSRLPGTLLLIEDDPDVSILIRQLLSEDGHQVITAATAEEGLTWFDPQIMDLVLLDAMLPGMSGWELCHELKRNQPAPYVPIMMLTARADLDDRVRGLDAGADDYLTKPFDIDELLAHVRAMLRIRRAEVKLWRRAHDLTLLNDVAQAVNSSLELNEILVLALSRLTTITRANLGAFWIHDEGSNRYRLAAHTGLTADQLELLQQERQANLEQLATTSHNGLSSCSSLFGRQLTSLIYLPLTANSATVGLLMLASDQAAAFSGDRLPLLNTLAATIAMAIDKANLYNRTRRFAETDPLTDLYNHRFMQDSIEIEISRAQRSRRPFVIMMIDLDNFKAYNDTYLHQAGDQLLQETAAMLITACRKTDRVGRYGGDEFIVLLPETNASQASTLARRVHSIFSTLPAVQRHDAVPIGLSIGIAIYPFDGAVRSQLVKSADVALYEAKRVGKSRTIVASGSSPLTRLPDQSFFEHLKGLVRLLDQRIGFGYQHAIWTTRYALLLAEQCALGNDERQAVSIAGLLHDAGNIGISADLLRRAGPLSSEEYEVVKQHVILSEMIIEEIPLLELVLEAVIHHHERWDGGGYPRGLAGSAIPLLGRIIALADTYAALRAPRPYRAAYDQEAALAILGQSGGTQHDPGLVGPFISAIRAGHESLYATVAESDRP